MRTGADGAEAEVVDGGEEVREVSEGAVEVREDNRCLAALGLEEAEVIQALQNFQEIPEERKGERRRGREVERGDKGVSEMKHNERMGRLTLEGQQREDRC